MDPRQPYLILGIGNCLLSDDGVGVHAARLLQAEPPPETTVLAVETDFLSALPFLERCAKALVIDAMDAGQPPGTLYHCRSEDLAESGQRHSLHGLGLLEALEFLDEGHRPEVHILGRSAGSDRTRPGLVAASGCRVAPGCPGGTSESLRNLDIRMRRLHYPWR